MDTFKFACPVCSQHISVGVSQSGTQMECPTCFQKIVIPQAPADPNTKFILTGSKVQERPASVVPGVGGIERPKSKFPFAAVGFCVILIAAGATGFIFRDKIFRRSPAAGTSADDDDTVKTQAVASVSTPLPPPPSAPDTNWSLTLTNVAIPDTTASGRINGRDFNCEIAVIQGGRLDLRQGRKWPPDVGVTIALFAERSEDLANKSVNVVPDQERKPEITLRWKDEQGQPQNKKIKGGYAMRIQFGPVQGSRLSGKIYLCTPDDYKSWAAGAFDAQIRKPKPPAPKKP